jgi:hypothetical protein
MSGIDWSQAPEGAMGHALIGQSFRPVWVGNDWYEYIGGGRHRFASDPDAFYAFARSELHDYAENPSVPAWAGAGLPPVGTVCERAWSGEEESYQRVKVLAHDGDLAIFRWVDGPRAGELQDDRQDVVQGIPIFRPIRTPEQIAAEEREAAIGDIELLIMHGDTDEEIARILYGAGYRKQPDNG